MTQIDNVRLPPDIEAGAEIGPMFQTSIITLTSGKEQRNQDWEQERLKANIGWGMMRDKNAELRPDGEIDRTFKEVTAFYRARRGMARGFLFKDWSDYKAENVVIGEGDGTNKTFQLSMTYEDEGGSYVRRITRPVASTVKVYADGVLLTGWTLSALGVIVLAGTAPEDGAEITADFEFDVPMRFATDVMSVQMAWARAGEIRDIDIVQVRE